MSIRFKLTIMFLAIASIPLLLVSALTFTNYKNSLEANRFAQLRDLTILRADRIESYFAGLKVHIEIAQGFYNVKQNFPVLTRLADDPNNPEFLAAKNMLNEQLQQMQSVSDLSDIMLVNPQGKVVYANKPEHYSKDLSNGYDAEQKAFTEGKNRIYYSDVYFDKAEDNRFEILLTAPAYDFNDAFIGVIAFEVDMTPAYKLIQDTTGLGNTGETLIGKKIGNQVLYLNPLRHDPKAALTRRITIGEEIGRPMQEAVQGRTGFGQEIDYRGEKNIAAWRYIPSLGWGLVAKIDTREAFADVTNLKNLAMITLVIVFVLSGVIAFSIAQSISEPIKRLSKGAEIIGSGNLDYKIETNLKDEIGQLSRSFDKMTVDLKQTLASRDELNKEITERKKAEESLRESQTDLNRAQAVAHSGSWRLDTRSNKLTWSDEAYRIFGVPIGTELTYEMFLTHIHHDDRESVDTKWKAALTGEKYDIEHRIVVDDQVKWVRERAELEVEKDGSISGGFGTVTDITERKNREQELHKLNRTLRALSNSIQAMMQATDESEYLEKVCNIVVRDCGHVMAWVGFAEDDENKTVRSVTNAGFEQGYLETLNITWADTERGRGPTGMAIRTGKLSMCRNMLTDPVLEPWRKEAIKRGYASSIALPLISDGKTFGALTIYSREPDPFSDDEVNLLTELADDLAYGIAAIRLRIAHTQAEEAVRKSRDELEIRVKERTAQLTHTVETLQEEVKLRTQAEKTIKAERKRFENVLEMMPAYAVLLTPDYHVAYANHTFREWFGDDNGRKCYEFLFNRKEPCENCQTYNVMKTGKSQFWEWTGPNGHNYDIYDYPFTDTDGSPLIMEIGVDVTAHKQAQTALRSASLYARGLLEASLDPMVTISPKGKITDVNKATELVTGATREQLIGTDFSNYFTEQDKARKGYQQVFADGFVTDYPLTIRHRDGQLTDVLYNAAVYKDTHGNVIGVFAAARDVTERKAAQERENVTNSLLHMFAEKVSRKAYLESTVEKIHNWSGCEFIGIRIRDAQGNIPYESCVGFDKDFLALENALHLGRDKCICIRAILENPQQQEQKFMTAGGSFYCNDSLAFLKGLPQQYHKEYRANCMKKGFQSIAVIPIRYHEQVTGAIHITDFKKGMVPLSKIQFIETSIAPLIGEAVQRFTAEAELEKHRLHLEELVKQRTEDLTRSNKELEQFAYVASHDLQEPLRMISGYTQLLQRRYKNKLDEDANQFIFYTVDGVLRMQTLINDLLTYSRLETRGKPFEPANCQAILDDVLVTLQTAIGESNAVITHGMLPTVQADRIQLFQLFQNLIGNAIKFRGDKPPLIHIAAEPKDGRWLFSISDNGIGIDPQYAERIFVIFQRLHSRDKYPGTGIGLAICKKIVERHGGRIWVESQMGNGSTFYFVI